MLLPNSKPNSPYRLSPSPSITSGAPGHGCVGGFAGPNPIEWVDIDALIRRTGARLDPIDVELIEELDDMGGSMSGLAAQFQDIGVTAAMVMNPAVFALQQGTQIAGQMEFAMQGGAKATDVLGTAFRSLFSPLTFITIALSAQVLFWMVSMAPASPVTTGARDHAREKDIPHGEIPVEVESAAYELALAELLQPGSSSPILTPGRLVKRQKVDTIEREFFGPNEGVPGQLMTCARS